MKIADLVIPEPDLEDPGTLAAWYSGFAFAESYRKIVLAQCRELVRAKFVAANAKITESRIDDLARNHPSYLAFLETHLHGRVSWERHFLRSGGMR